MSAGECTQVLDGAAVKAASECGEAGLMLREVLEKLGIRVHLEPLAEADGVEEFGLGDQRVHWRVREDRTLGAGEE